MLFLTLQDIPRNQELEGDGIVSLEDVPTPEIKELGGRVIWAVPVTTFKETMASMMLIAPNYPMLMFLLSSDDYTRIDKVAYYQALSSGRRAHPRASDDLPPWLCEYCIPREKGRFLVKNIFPVCMAESFMDGETPLWKCLGLPKRSASSLSMSFERYMRDKLKGLPKCDVDAMAQVYSESAFGNPRVRAISNYNWQLFQRTFLPLIVWMWANDTSKRTALDDGTDSVTLFSAACEGFSGYTRSMAFSRLQNEMAMWSYGECRPDGFKDIYNSMLDLICDDVDVLTTWADNVPIGRNDPCPCGSGRKYKKCHGRLDLS